MKKAVSVAVAAVLAGTSLSVLAGCGKKVDSDNPETLEVYVCNLGYGYQWAEQMLNAFKEEAWVKEKYPNLQVSFSQDAVEQNSKNWLTNNSTDYDVIMCTILEGFLGEGNSAVDLTELVYEKTIPGENVTFAKKMFDSVLESNRDPSSTAEDPHYYTATFASGMTGIAYNATVLAALGFEEPNTTDELFAICESIATGTYVSGASGDYTVGASVDKNVYSSDKAFISYGVSAYVNYLVETWWAQYEGVSGYVNYFRGMDSEGNLTSAVVRQKGKRKALEATEEMMEYTGLVASAERDAYRRAQNQVVLGTALFMANGDWFDMEERDFAANAPGAGEVRLMNAPVVSSIRENTPSIPDDATLSLVVEAVDSGCNTIAEAEEAFPDLAGKNVKEPDFQTVHDARMLVYSIGPRHNVVIPECSPAKELAADFILYMATDKSLETYASVTGGASLPFDYDYEQNATLWNSFSAMQKQRLTLFTDPDLNIMPNVAMYPLVLRGGFSPWKPYGNPGYEFLTNAWTAQGLNDQIIAYWTDNNSSNFNTACAQAGIR